MLLENRRHEGRVDGRNHRGAQAGNPTFQVGTQTKAEGCLGAGKCHPHSPDTGHGQEVITGLGGRADPTRRTVL